ncbi:hypothetical protein D9V37_14495 [Nocardioides mangrovicus]|uniref:Uncharacterized protein n=1 Tax=Nocardioides mangrovicus TaxID=2478913 RepID=A0A3L8NZF2_9ACTN|nr:hypothetical protein D9V37_14495 [Nocardioides mangrovicus]
MSGEPDRYLAAGTVPAGAGATRIIVRTPTRQRSFPVDTWTGAYAIAMAFGPVSANIGTVHTEVALLAADGRVLWRGRWPVGTYGR